MKERLIILSEVYQTWRYKYRGQRPRSGPEHKHTWGPSDIDGVSSSDLPIPFHDVMFPPNYTAEECSTCGSIRITKSRGAKEP